MYIMSAMLDRATTARERAAAQAGPIERTRLHAEDVKGALACAWLVIASTFPVVVPFIFFDDAQFAIRLSNALLIVMLFLVGYQWGGYANVGKWISGAIFTVVGLFLVALAIALGG
jgi:VIT1/CCC1 family predicted Fe2+/Mn2+ transporter